MVMNYVAFRLGYIIIFYVVVLKLFTTINLYYLMIIIMEFVTIIWIYYHIRLTESKIM